MTPTLVGGRAQGRADDKKIQLLRGRTLINLFFEASTRTQSSFELAGKRLGADVMNMSVKTSSVSKGETLIDTASTLNAMRPDILVVRHQDAGAAELLSRKLERRLLALFSHLVVFFVRGRQICLCRSSMTAEVNLS